MIYAAVVNGFIMSIVLLFSHQLMTGIVMAFGLFGLSASVIIALFSD